MKFWFSSSDGATIPVVLLMFCAVFCELGLSTEADEEHAIAINGSVEIPCSLDDADGNRTDCNSSNPVSSGSPELSKTFQQNSTDDSSTQCPSNGCSTNDEQRNTTTPHETLSVKALNDISETSNQMDTTTMTEHFRTISTASNETDTPCPFGGCLESNVSESPSVGDTVTPSEDSENLTENSVSTHSVNTTFGLNGTMVSATSSINDTILVTVEMTKTTSDSMDEYELIPTEDHENSSVTATKLNHTNVSPTVQINNSAETDLVVDHSVTTDEDNNTSVSTLIAIDGSESDNITELVQTTTAYSYPESDNITDHVQITTAYSYPESDNITEHVQTTTAYSNPESDNITVYVQTTTVYSYPDTSSESLPNTNTTATSPDNSTLFYTSSSSIDSSTSVDENTESSTDTSNSVTDVPAITDTESPSESPSVSPQRTYIIVELRINCSDNGQEREIDLLVAQLLNGTLKNDNNEKCYNLHNVTLYIVHGSTDFATIHKVLSEKLKNVEIVRVIYEESSANTTHSDITPPPPDSDVTRSEMILYITLGVSLGAIFLIALAIICFKCCRRRPSKPVDLDVPHLNLRLEDYTLTRIPRPNTCYLDYFRGPVVSDHYNASVRNSMSAPSESNRGMIQPFDTSVVPLEDAKKLDQLASSPNRTSCPSTPLRTFGRKDWNQGDRLIYENVMSSSKEKLQPDFYKYGYPGAENPTFAA